MASITQSNINGFDKDLQVPTHTLLDSNQIYRAAESLLKFEKEKREAQNLLFEDPSYVQVILSLRMIPEKHRRSPYVVELVYPTFSEDAEICVFVKDPSKEYKEKIRDFMIPNVKKVIGVKQLREKYGRYEARRKLSQSYDLFLCDDSLSLVLPRLLGKVFFKTKKFPVPVKINSQLPAKVSQILKSAQIFVGANNTCNITMGLTSMQAKEITENIITSIDSIADKLPNGKWNNIESIFMKLPDSPSLPVYNGPIISNPGTSTIDETTQPMETEEPATKKPNNKQNTKQKVQETSPTNTKESGKKRKRNSTQKTKKQNDSQQQQANNQTGEKQKNSSQQNTPKKKKANVKKIKK